MPIPNQCAVAVESQKIGQAQTAVLLVLKLLAAPSCNCCKKAALSNVIIVHSGCAGMKSSRTYTLHKMQLWLILAEVGASFRKVAVCRMLRGRQ